VGGTLLHKSLNPAPISRFSVYQVVHEQGLGWYTTGHTRTRPLNPVQRSPAFAAIRRSPRPLQAVHPTTDSRLARRDQAENTPHHGPRPAQANAAPAELSVTASRSTG